MREQREDPLYLHVLVLALNLAGASLASLAVVNLRAVAILARAPGLKRAWGALALVLSCCIALQLADVALTATSDLSGDALVNSVINLLGPCFALTVSYLSRRTARDLLHMEALRDAAFVDPLTGLANRRRFDQKLVDEARRAGIARLPLTLLVLDIDHFKRVNDTHGHAVGDLMLKHVAALVSAKCRHLDTACRTGGEEFVVIVPGLEGPFAAAAAERLRRAVAETGLALEGGGEIRATVSLGLATLRPGESADALFRRADAALYGAKRGGRDRVSLAA